KECYATSTNRVSTVSSSVSDVGQSFDNVDDLPTDPLMPDLEDIIDLLNTGIFSGAYNNEDEGAEANLNNLETTMNVSPIPTTRIHKDHPKDQIIGDINSATQTRRTTKISEEHALVSLTISPTIYASYIEQFWATAKSKIVNNETQIHAKVDGKTIVISESSVRRNLHLNDEDGVTSLTNSKILENLALMGYKIVSNKLTFQKVKGEGSRQPSEPQPPSSTAPPSQEEQVISGGPPEKVGDEAIHKELGDRVERVATTAASLDEE
ncbi:hypothetical protein Tco_1454193, partial [Tanacetum coccineum]